MSRNAILLRVLGDIDRIDELVEAIGLPARVYRRGTINLVNQVQGMDVLVVELGKWRNVDEEDQATGEQGLLLSVAEHIHQLVPILTTLDRSRCRAELYVSTIREEEQGGLELPANLIAAAGAAGLSIGISILVMLEHDTPNGEST
jgi:hypothetical protein